MENFGIIIKRNREEKGWTQKELAHRLHVSDKRYLDITMLPVIVKTLESNYEYGYTSQYMMKEQLIQADELSIHFLPLDFFLALIKQKKMIY